jgi:serine/threonine protein kinase
MHSSLPHSENDPRLPPFSERDSVPLSTSGPTDGGRETRKEYLVRRAPLPPGINTAFGEQGRYWLLEQIASGGMGVVYKARQQDLDRIVALKMIRPDVGLSKERVLRFEREARAAARLQQPNIVSIFDIGEWQGLPYYTMQYAACGSLDDRQERLAHAAAALLVEKIARALAYAHANGVLHRDLKPSNVLLHEHGEPLVSDFGLAKFWDSDVELTREGELLGTPAYMAPEQAAASGATLTGAADVWALGVILYELLTGQRPFPGKARHDVLTQIRCHEPPMPSALDAQLDSRLEAIVLRCLDKDPARRYTAAQLADDLACWRRREPLHQRPDSWLTRAWRAGRLQVQHLGVFRLLALLILLLILIRLWLPPPPPPPGAPPPPWMRPPPGK